MKIAIGCDHGGFKLKQVLIKYLKEKGHNIIDAGCFSDERCDYPQYSFKAAKLVSDKKADRAVVICKSGIGNSIVANKLKGVRCALCYNTAQARSSRAHNDANAISLGAVYTTPKKAKNILSAWLSTDFEGGRHAERIRQIEAIERKVFKKSL